MERKKQIKQRFKHSDKLSEYDTASWQSQEQHMKRTDIMAGKTENE